MTAPVREAATLRRSLSVWQAVGLSAALMAPSVAANINPQGTAGLVGRVPVWEIVVPLGALALPGYTIYRNVIPYPTSGPARWFPVVAFGWVVLVALVAFLVPGFASRLAVGLGSLDPTEPERLGG